MPFDDAAVLGHLTGRHVMGVYPLLADETCWFLAVDFDKSTWIEDVGAFVETCRMPISCAQSASAAACCTRQEVRIFDYVDCEVPVLMRMFQNVDQLFIEHRPKYQMVGTPTDAYLRLFFTPQRGCVRMDSC